MVDNSSLIRFRESTLSAVRIGGHTPSEGRMAFPVRKRRQIGHLVFLLHWLRTRRPGVRVSPGAPLLPGYRITYKAVPVFCRPQRMPTNGFSMTMPAILWPAFKSSDRIRVAPFFEADETIRASQKPIRDSSSIRNAEAISAGVVSVHQIA